MPISGYNTYAYQLFISMDFSVPKSDRKRLYLLLTEQCNLNCKHCYLGPNSSRTGGLSLPTIEAALRHYFSLGYRLVEFTGGEPTLSPHLYPAVQLALQIGYPEVGISTNGTIPSVFDRFTPSEISKFTFSLDGADEKTHDQIRQPGHFQTTISSIKLAIDKGFTVHAVTTVNQLNRHQVTRLASLADSLGIARLSFNFISPVGSARLNPDLHITPQNWLDVVRELLSIKNLSRTTLRFPKRFALPDEISTNSNYRCPLSDPNQVFIMGNGQCFHCCLLMEQKRLCTSQATAHGVSSVSPGEKSLLSQYPETICPALQYLSDQGDYTELNSQYIPLCVYQKEFV